MVTLEERNKISDFITKRKTIKKVEMPEVQSIDKVPWYKRPLEKGEFKYRLAKNGKYYIRHNEWSEVVWIGPYNNPSEVESIVNSYIEESLKNPLDRKFLNHGVVHSVTIDNPSTFF